MSSNAPTKSAPPTEITLKIIKVLKLIPPGRVATYQQIAEIAGLANGSRSVVRVLKTCSEDYDLPWQRVISARGRIAFKPKSPNFLLQRRLLRKEGVEVEMLQGEIDLTKYKWARRPRARKNQPRMFS